MTRQGRAPVRQTEIASEMNEQIDYFRWVVLNKAIIPGLKMIHSTPNEAKRSVLMGVIMKRMGLAPGYPDISIDVARGGYHGARIEMKRSDKMYDKTGGVKDNQNTWHYDLIAEGYFVAVAYNWEEAKNITLAYLDGKASDYGKLPSSGAVSRPATRRT